jgi:DNA-binding NarL/FixJ family response regulator
VTRVLLVEDNDVYRTSLELLLAARPGLEVVGAVPSGAEALEAAARLRPDVALVDYRLPDLDGADVVAALLRLDPPPAVICLTAAATDGERSAVVAAGALEVVEKGDLQTLVDAIAAATSTS